MEYLGNSWVRKMSVLMFFFGLASCDPYKGTIKIFHGLEWIDKDEIVYIPAGSYPAELEFKKKDRVELDVQLEGAEDDIRLHIPEDVHFPEYNGDIFLSSEDSGQPWDVEGEVETNTTRSDAYSARENCSYRARERICERRDGRRHCWYEYVTRYGYKEVEYYNKYTRSNIGLDLIDPASQRLLANFKGYRSDSEKVYTFQGNCY